MAKLQKNQRIAIADVMIDRALNVRETDDETYKVDALREDIALRGQLEAATLERKRLPDGRVIYYPIRGFLRSTAILQLATENIIDPETMKRDDSGNIIPGTGKVFEFIKAEVWEDLTERERTNLLVDHGQRRGLSKVELHFAIERCLNAGYSEKETVVMLRMLLEVHYPLNVKQKAELDSPEKLLNFYRGVLQTAKEAWRGPKLMRDAWVNKLRGNQAWPTKQEMMDGVKIFKKAQDSDKTGTINRDNPGAEFMTFWERLTAAQAEGEETGNAPKSVSMLGRGQVVDCQSLSSSRIGKAYFSMVLNDGKVDRSKLPTLDALLVSLEAKLTNDEKLVLDTIYSVVPTVAGVPATAPVSEPAAV